MGGGRRKGQRHAPPGRPAGPAAAPRLVQPFARGARLLAANDNRRSTGARVRRGLLAAAALVLAAAAVWLAFGG